MSKAETEVRVVSKKQVGAEMVADRRELRKAKKEGRKSMLSAPKKPPMALNGVDNPIVKEKGLKRALLITIVGKCVKDGKLDLEKACGVVRASGILYKAGWKDENPTDPLTQGEWSGQSYVRFSTKPEGKVYAQKHAEKVAKCEAFADQLLAAYREEREAMKATDAQAVAKK